MKALFEKFLESMTQGGVGYFLLLLLSFVGLIVVAIVAEIYVKKITKKEDRMPRTKKMTLVALFSALAMVLMLFDFPLWFAPGFYELDFSEVPVLIVSFIAGPMAGFAAEFLKILLKLIFKPTATAFVGEFANLLIGASFVIPASVIYHIRKNKKSAMIGLATGSTVMAAIGSFANAFILLPAYAFLFGGIEVKYLIAAGTEINPMITDIKTFIILAVLPFNILKGVIVSLLTYFIYQRIRKLKIFN